MTRCSRACNKIVVREIWESMNREDGTPITDYLSESHVGSPPRKTASRPAWLALELDAGEKLTNLVVTDCKTSLC